ncbi:MAG: hypothetical protein NTX86_06295 [Candidatus Dependentiae bacterium]|nr:hypothetical protein [Candidatus Dependentiae bacterium]
MNILKSLLYITIISASFPFDSLYGNCCSSPKSSSTTRILCSTDGSCGHCVNSLKLVKAGQNEALIFVDGQNNPVLITDPSYIVYQNCPNCNHAITSHTCDAHGVDRMETPTPYERVPEITKK